MCVFHRAPCLSIDLSRATPQQSRRNCCCCPPSEGRRSKGKKNVAPVATRCIVGGRNNFASFHGTLEGQKTASVVPASLLALTGLTRAGRSLCSVAGKLDRPSTSTAVPCQVSCLSVCLAAMSSYAPLASCPPPQPSRRLWRQCNTARAVSQRVSTHRPSIPASSAARGSLFGVAGGRPARSGANRPLRVGLGRKRGKAKGWLRAFAWPELLPVARQRQNQAVFLDNARPTAGHIARSAPPILRSLPSTEKNTADSTPVSTNISTSPTIYLLLVRGANFPQFSFQCLPASRCAGVCGHWSDALLAWGSECGGGGLTLPHDLPNCTASSPLLAEVVVRQRAPANQTPPSIRPFLALPPPLVFFVPGRHCHLRSAPRGTCSGARCAMQRRRTVRAPDQRPQAAVAKVAARYLLRAIRPDTWTLPLRPMDLSMHWTHPRTAPAAASRWTLRLDPDGPVCRPARTFNNSAPSPPRALAAAHGAGLVRGRGGGGGGER